MENNSGGMGSGEEGKSVEELEFERLTEVFLAESGCMDEVLGGLRSFRDMGESSSTVQRVMGVKLNSEIGGESSSSSAVALERENIDHDTHNKRPKVHSFSL